MNHFNLVLCVLLTTASGNRKLAEHEIKMNHFSIKLVALLEHWQLEII